MVLEVGSDYRGSTVSEIQISFHLEILTVMFRSHKLCNPHVNELQVVGQHCGTK
jgi:hypothetical protein